MSSFLAKYAPKLAKFEQNELAHACSRALISFTAKNSQTDPKNEIRVRRTSGEVIVLL